MFGGSVLPGEDNKTGRKRRRRFDFDAEWSIGPRSTAWDVLWARLVAHALKQLTQLETKRTATVQEELADEVNGTGGDARTSED